MNHSSFDWLGYIHDTFACRWNDSHKKNTSRHETPTFLSSKLSKGFVTPTHPNLPLQPKLTFLWLHLLQSLNHDPICPLTPRSCHWIIEKRRGNYGSYSKRGTLYFIFWDKITISLEVLNMIQSRIRWFIKVILSLTQKKLRKRRVVWCGPSVDHTSSLVCMYEYVFCLFAVDFP